MSEASRQVSQAAKDARSNDDLVREEFDLSVWSGGNTLDSPLDEETLDEQASTQMGELWGSRRRDAE